MFFDNLLVRADRNSTTATLSQFLAGPEEILTSADGRIWLGSEETFGQFPDRLESLPLDDGMIQFHSDPILQELCQAASPSVNAALGISGLTAVSRAIVEAALASHEYDLSQSETALNVEFFLSLADRSSPWKVEPQRATSFRYFSPLPLQEPPVDRKLLDTLRSLSDDRLTNGNPAKTAATEIRAGLLLIHDYLEPSHQYSQSIEGAGPDVNGDYWHGLMHRREPDFGNSKYWFRRVGNHPCFVRVAEAARQLTGQFNDPRLTEQVGKLTQSGWDSLAAVNFFQQAHRPDWHGTVISEFASCLQMQEMLILLAYCCREH